VHYVTFSIIIRSSSGLISTGPSEIQIDLSRHILEKPLVGANQPHGFPFPRGGSICPFLVRRDTARRCHLVTASAHEPGRHRHRRAVAWLPLPVSLAVLLCSD
jgi:hypothetical protein